MATIDQEHLCVGYGMCISYLGYAINYAKKGRDSQSNFKW